MPGITGANVNVGWAFSNTWGVPASVTKGAYLAGISGLDGGPAIVDDDAFNQSFIGEGEAGDYSAPTPEIGMQVRYEGAVPNWIAMAMGSASAPSVVSSAGANSLVAYQHVLTMAPTLSKYITLAIDQAQYVLEVTTLKVRGFNMKVGDNGRMNVTFPATGSAPTYISSVNVNSTVGPAAATVTLLNRMYRNQGVFRMNLQSAGTLGNSDAISNARDISFGLTTPLTGDDDHIFGQTYIVEPDVDGFAELPVEITFARMNTVSANSLVTALRSAAIFKADLTFTGLYVNSTTQRSMKFEWPSLQLYDFKADFTGHNQVRPVGSFKAKMPSTQPSGMAFSQPLRVTVVNANSLNLLS